MKPIYEVMYDNHLIEKRMFSLCLGKNGGSFQIGGYDSDNHISEIQWAPLTEKSYYKIAIEEIKINSIPIKDVSSVKLGMLDSGTTFSYLPNILFS